MATHKYLWPKDGEYKMCVDCGAALDPNESCDCDETEPANRCGTRLSEDQDAYFGVDLSSTGDFISFGTCAGIVGEINPEIRRIVEENLRRIANEKRDKTRY